MSRRSVLIADDHALFRDAITTLLQAFGFEVVGQAGDGQEAIELARRLKPDLVLLDIRMPGTAGIFALREIKRHRQDIRIVMLTMSNEDHDVFAALREGADGYIVKTTDGSEFRDLLERVFDESAALSPSIQRRLMRRVRETGQTPGIDARGGLETLTAREVDVLQIVATGMTNAEIAPALYITESTVKFHVSRILAKLGLRNRVEASKYAVKAGMIPGDDEAVAAKI